MYIDSEGRKGRTAEAWDYAVYALATIHGLASHCMSLDAEADRVELLRMNETRGPVALSSLSVAVRGWLMEIGVTNSNLTDTGPPK